jgi:hypothetical protein
MEVTMRRLTTDSVWLVCALVWAAAGAGCFSGTGDGTGQAGVSGGGNAGTGPGGTGAGIGASGTGVGGTGIAGTGAGGTGAGGDGCNGQIPAICRVCNDGACGEAVCRGGMYVFVCPEDGTGGTGVAGTGTGGVGGECFVGGCSNQLCTDQPGAASTCEWREEYACYQTATCERQGDGQCGWTRTPELEKCLGGGTGAFQWYQTCGDPVCQFPSPPSGVPPCKTQVVGGACMEGEAECDPGTGCGATLVCANSDPTNGGLCPVSRREHKADIEYLDEAGREAFAREIEQVRLATYRYKNDPKARTHLGFIMEDVEPSVSADSGHGVVDLYGYMSMAVAALQEQRGEIDTLKKELKSLRRACK